MITNALLLMILIALWRFNAAAARPQQAMVLPGQTLSNAMLHELQRLVTQTNNVITMGGGSRHA